MTIKEMVNDYLMSIKVDTKFGMRDICAYINTITCGTRNPLDSTVGRAVRRWRAENPYYDIVCCNHATAQYKKVVREGVCAECLV